MLFGTGAPETIDPATLKTPATRMKNAIDVQNFARCLINNDSKRSYKRARLNGLIDGRPPYLASKLRELGRADATNVNWGRARAYMEAGTGTFYDLFSEAPSYLTVITNHGTPEERQTWSDIISEEADLALRSSPVFDYEMSLSIDNQVLHGCGPLMFEDKYRCIPKAFLCGDLKVPEFAKSDTYYWETGMVQGSYYPVELYDFIRNPRLAGVVGWNVEHTRKVIANAVGIKQASGLYYEWEFYEAEMKNNAYSYMDEAKICYLAHVLWKEFDGTITHAIVERDSASGLPAEFLYLNPGRYKGFNNVVHPMYWDHGNGGYHHSVTGLGVKMFGAMESENRLLCNLMDKAFSPKMLFKPGSAEATQRIQITRYGDYGVLPRGADAVQMPVAGVMQDGEAMLEIIGNVNADTLSNYKQKPVMQTGNPPTKFQKMYEATMQAALSKTQLNRYYKQLDMLYQEIYRRLSNLNTTCPIAKAFQEACGQRGVPREAIVRTKAVQATRVAGQGSGFMRKVAIDSIFTVAAALPEEGRDNLVKDKIAAEAGQHAVSRYFPQRQPPMPTDQEVDALTQVAVMKVGMPTKIASSQNPVTYATTFVQSAMQALASLGKGGDPHEVLRFLSLIGPAIAAHLKRFEQDTTRTAIHAAIQARLQAISQAAGKLKQALAAQSKQQRQQAQKTGQVMNDQQLKTAATMADIKRKDIKQQAQMRQRQQRQQFDMALDDAATAHDLTLNRIRAFQE